jgi:prepilin-type N-terminal cleavage/methylation domain-containing protein
MNLAACRCMSYRPATPPAYRRASPLPMPALQPPSSGLSPRRRGLTLIEVVVTVVIISILAAAVAPAIAGILDRERVNSASESIDALVEAISAMRSDNQDWPAKLSHLSVPITVSDKNICGATYSSGKVSQWAGPYISRTIPTTGVPIGIGTARDSLVREVISGNDAYLKLQVDDVTAEDASELDKLYDNDGSAGGTIRWGSASGTGQVTLYVLRPIRGC